MSKPPKSGRELAEKYGMKPHGQKPIISYCEDPELHKRLNSSQKHEQPPERECVWTFNDLNWTELDRKTVKNMIAELQSLRKRVRELEEAIDEHNRDCETMCNSRGESCVAWTSRNMRCTDCPKDYLIEKGDQQ